MFPSYTASALSLRAKWSFYHTNVPFSGERSCCCCRCRCRCRDEVPINPRSLYEYILKRSALIQWTPSRRMLTGGVRRFQLVPRGSDGGFREMIALLAEFDGVYSDSSGFGSDFNGGGIASKRRENGGRLRRDRPGVSCYSGGSSESYRKRGCFENVDEKQVGKRENGGSVRASSSSNVAMDSGHGESGVLRKRGMGARKVAQSSEMRDDEKGGSLNSRKVSAWKTRDEEEEEVSLVGCYSDHRENYTIGEKRREGSQKHISMRTGDQEDVKRVSNSRRSSGVEIRDMEASWSRDLDYEEREKYIYGDSVVGRRNAGRGAQKAVRISEVHEEDRTKASSSNNLVDTRMMDSRVTSSSAVKWDTKEDQRVAEHAELSMNSGRVTEASEILGTGIDRSSFSQKNYDETRVWNREDQSKSYQDLVQVMGNERNRVNQQSLNQVDLSKQTTQYEGHTNVSGISYSQKHSEEKLMKNIEEKSTSVQKTVQSVRDKRTRVDQQPVKEMNLTKQAKHYEDHITSSSRNSQTQKHFKDTRLKDVEDKSTSVQETVQLVRGNRTRLDQQYIERANINKKYEDDTDISGVILSDPGRISSSQKLAAAAARMDDQEESSSSVVNLVHGVSGQHHQSSNRLHEQYGSKEESERYAQIYKSSRSNMHQAFGYQESSKSTTENRKESSPLLLTKERKDKQGAYIQRSSQSKGTQTAFSGSSESSSGSGYRKVLEQEDQTSRDESYLEKTDVLETLSRFDKSSSLYVGEFVDKVRQEISASDELDNASRYSSEIKMQEIGRGSSETTTEAQVESLVSTSKYKDEKKGHESGRQSSSSRSGRKGPPDELWEVRGHSSQDPSTEEHQADASPVGNREPDIGTEGAITRRSHRSLWTYIADIIRKGWGSNAESRTSTFKSGMRSSSNESVSSETWFSGHEPDEDDFEIKKKGKGSSPKEMTGGSSVDHSQPTTATKQRKPETARVEERLALLEGGRTASLKVSEGASVVARPESPRTEEREKFLESRTAPLKVSEGVFLVSRPESLQWPEGEKEMQVVSSGMVVGQSSAPVGDSPLSTIQQEITVTEIRKSEEELKIEKAPEVVETMGKDTELKQRKLQRNKQVLKESFDEWEEAYKLESEQRKIDELFMREALLEAKKAADSWEVPVGAVLVQNGKIIARGCNQVEEFRDSTAHAEMICIREASNILRTWRLADTTLYVTLEPCAMCAGAILQARIDTVVWGAPNKLLGADGSWVRLFPAGDGGSSSLDPSTQTSGPVHPFHPKITIRRAVLAGECADTMQQFFRLRRKKDKKPEPSQPSCLPISTHPSKFLTKMHDLFCIMFCL